MNPLSSFTRFARKIHSPQRGKQVKCSFNNKKDYIFIRFVVFFVFLQPLCMYSFRDFFGTAKELYFAQQSEIYLSMSEIADGGEICFSASCFVGDGAPDVPKFLEL